MKKAQVPKQDLRFGQIKRRKSVHLDLRLSATQQDYFNTDFGKKQKGNLGGMGGKCVFGVYNRHRQLAARSSDKQQAACTAVRAALMVCFEESLLPASGYDNYAAIIPRLRA